MGVCSRFDESRSRGTLEVIPTVDYKMDIFRRANVYEEKSISEPPEPSLLQPTLPTSQFLWDPNVNDHE
jgi:hypothetical protein